jgi:uncharacterized protein (DUF1697 family)
VHRYIVLLRGINVGGKNLVPMKPLVALLEQQCFEQVSYYIQSGNLVLSSAAHPCSVIKTIIGEHFGFTPNVFVLSVNELFTAMDNNPYREFEGKFVHFYFCENAIESNVEKIERWISATEDYYVENNVFYLHAPEGVGRSKLVSHIESCLGQVATGRNLNTMNKVANLID